MLNVPTSPPLTLQNETDDPGARDTLKKGNFVFASDNNSPSKRCLHDSHYYDRMLIFVSVSLPSTQKKRKAERSDNESVLPSDIKWERYILYSASDLYMPN